MSKLKKVSARLTVLLIVYKLEWMYSMLGVNKKITSEGILNLATMIMEDKYYLKMEEFDRIIDNGISGMYGKIFGAIDASIIFDWINQYELSDELISSWENKASDFKKAENKGRNISILEIPHFKKMVLDKLPKKRIGLSIQNEKSIEQHKADIRKQAEQIMKNHKDKKNEK